MQKNDRNRNVALAEQLSSLKPGGAPITAQLRTSHKVLRRVTDGIYREPWAALRELISNAYDADATTVEITTDPPWFRRVTVRDNGNGFTQDALAQALENIGGSAKRTSIGSELGVTSSKDETRSPGGRRLIGKLGIGLFAVSHLSSEFQIITKSRGSKYRTVADISLFKNREESGDGKPISDDESLKAGSVRISVVPADDVDAHGTDIIIQPIWPKVCAEFQSAELWAMRKSAADDDDAKPAPAFHIGVPSPSKPSAFVEVPKVPWREDDDPLQRFRALADAMFDRIDAPGAGRKPSLSTTFDNYFRFVWLLSLGAPLDYIDKHPFDLDSSSGFKFYRLGELKGQATEVVLPRGKTLRQHLGLKAPERGSAKGFRVVVDGIELRRPIRVSGLVGSGSAPSPMLFVGQDEPDLSRYDENQTGGRLRFEGYLMWSHRVVPFDHVGSLVRVGDSSGSLFDSTFMNYPVSEQKRKEQVTAEIFAIHGLDAALNIDRESFNRTHPHYQYVARWLHDAFRQFANKHKDVGRVVREAQLVEHAAESSQRLQAAVREIVAKRTDGEAPIDIEIADEPSLFNRKKATIVLSSKAIYSSLSGAQRITKPEVARVAHRELKLGGVLQILYASHLLDNLTPKQLESLAVDLARVIFCEEEA